MRKKQIMELLTILTNTLKTFEEFINNFANQMNIWMDLPIIRTLRLIGTILTVVLIPIWIILIIKNNKIKDVVEKYKTLWEGKKYEKKYILKSWKVIEKLEEENNLSSLDLAFKMLNELLEEIVKRMNAKGVNLIEKIKNLKIAELTESEKTKILVGAYAYEKMKQDPSFHLEPKEIKYFIKVYREFFERINLLE